MQSDGLCVRVCARACVCVCVCVYGLYARDFSFANFASRGRDTRALTRQEYCFSNANLMQKCAAGILRGMIRLSVGWKFCVFNVVGSSADAIR